MKIVENFKKFGVVKIDSKNRITLGEIIKRFIAFSKIASIDDFETFIAESGNILLVPRTSIPTRELWVHKNPEIKEAIEEGIKDAQEGRVKEIEDIDEFFDTL